MAKGADLLFDLASDRQEAKLLRRQNVNPPKVATVSAESSQNVNARLSVTGIDPDLKRRLKHYAVEHDISLSTVVQTAVNEYLERNA